MHTKPDPTAEITGPAAPAPVVPPADPEPRGCLYALSQPPLMLFLSVIATLIGLTGAYDLFLL